MVAAIICNLFIVGSIVICRSIDVDTDINIVISNVLVVGSIVIVAELT